MGLTFKISGDSFAKYDRSSNEMNSAIVEYIEGIEVIKAFGRAGVSYEKYAGAITSFRTFVVKWLTSTFVTMKLSFALFPPRSSARCRWRSRWQTAASSRPRRRRLP